MTYINIHYTNGAIEEIEIREPQEYENKIEELEEMKAAGVVAWYKTFWR